MTHTAVEVWLFSRGGGGPANEIRRLLEAECSTRGWSPVLRPIHRNRTSEGRPLSPINNEDATNLYKRIHQVRVGVWQVGHARAPIKPYPRPVVNDYVELHRFIRHKAFHCRLSAKDFKGKWHSSLAAFDAWLQQVCCEGEGDPRCLPFHVFDTDFEIDKLATPRGRSEFAETHGPQSARRDSNDIRWNRPKGAYHGRETLHIAGRDLVRGFHWDVSSGATRRRIATTKDIWELAANGYVNVYPDQHIRGGHSAKRRIPTGKRKAR